MAYRWCWPRSFLPTSRIIDAIQHKTSVASVPNSFLESGSANVVSGVTVVYGWRITAILFYERIIRRTEHIKILPKYINLNVNQLTECFSLFFIKYSNFSSETFTRKVTFEKKPWFKVCKLSIFNVLKECRKTETLERSFLQETFSMQVHPSHYEVGVLVRNGDGVKILFYFFPATWASNWCLRQYVVNSRECLHIFRFFNFISSYR